MACERVKRVREGRYGATRGVRSFTYQGGKGLKAVNDVVLVGIEGSEESVGGSIDVLDGQVGRDRRHNGSPQLPIHSPPVGIKLRVSVRGGWE